eukprot:TRINITY_DN6137_c1_g1_i4.p1 TRINITY_DN6137_c1_g1~~TRINITY_DN6137_c1_g1_i4.p1  ORF type:complete len:222 (-),score=38.78 TRINITY_DN6137_c1_g1_i4:411-1076(-)
MLVDHFAIYVNFMLVDGMGNPRPLVERRAANSDEDQKAGDSELEHPRAVEHLKELLKNLEAELKDQLPLSIVLIGFSKGAAVLNAFLREPDDVEFWRRVESLHFVDAGLMVPGVFPVGLEALERLKSIVLDNFTVWLHCTPRQLQDESRQFIPEEQEAFAERCKASGINIERRSYCEGLPASLDMHFDSLRCFYTSKDDEDAGDQHCGFFARWKSSSEDCS